MVPQADYRLSSTFQCLSLIDLTNGDSRGISLKDVLDRGEQACPVRWSSEAWTTASRQEVGQKVTIRVKVRTVELYLDL